MAEVEVRELGVTREIVESVMHCQAIYVVCLGLGG